jgi:putative membrane protein
MAFGFVVVKFSLFVRQLSLLLHKEISVSQGGFSSIVGIFIVAFGILIGLFSYMRYVTVERQIEDGNYRPSRRLSLLLVVFVCVVGVALVVYLIRSVSY